MFGRTEPREVWGPSSEQPQLSLNASIAGLRQVHNISGNISGLIGCHIYICLFMIIAKEIRTKQGLYCACGMHCCWGQILPKLSLSAHQNALSASVQ